MSSSCLSLTNERHSEQGSRRGPAFELGLMRLLSGYRYTAFPSLMISPAQGCHGALLNETVVVVVTIHDKSSGDNELVGVKSRAT
jgi:hypothetical protein